MEYADEITSKLPEKSRDCCCLQVTFFFKTTHSFVLHILNTSSHQPFKTTRTDVNINNNFLQQNYIN